jgi:hypothetical protein
VEEAQVPIFAKKVDFALVRSLHPERYKAHYLPSMPGAVEVR